MCYPCCSLAVTWKVFTFFPLVAIIAHQECCGTELQEALKTREQRPCWGAWLELLAVPEELGKGGAGKAHHETREVWRELFRWIWVARAACWIKMCQGKPQQCRVCARSTRRAGFGSGLERRCSGCSQTLLGALCWRANTHQKHLWLNSDRGGIIRMTHRGNLAWKVAQFFK